MCTVTRTGSWTAGDVSVIIPVKEVTAYAREAAAEVHARFPECEILLVTDHPAAEQLAGTTILASWPDTAPGRKRDLAASVATGKILAFLDDDAYPGTSWLSSALPHFDSDDVAAVGGPGVTPPSNDIRQRASGWILASPLGSGGYTYRFRPGKRRDVDDFPSMNLLVRRADYEAAGGFGSQFWPGEDTELCRKLGAELGKRIVYEPGAVVYHHRRPVFAGHLRQQARYGLHRGHFARRFAGNSRRIAYGIPSLFTVGVVAGPLASMAYRPLLKLYLGVLGVYATAVALSTAWVWHHDRDVRVAGLAAGGLVATHVTYGLAYLKGLCSRHLAH